MNRRLLWVGIGVVVLIGLAAALTFMFSPRKLRGSVIDPPLPVPEISLTDFNGQPFRLSDYRGKIVLLFFGYTYCSDVCPTTMAVLKQARGQLNEEQAARVQVVLITVDPQRDTSQTLQDYLAHFDSTFIGLSGTEEELSPVWKAYGVFRELGKPNAQGNYEVSHTARVYVIDAQGNLSLSFPFGVTADDVANDLLILLR